MYMYVVYRYEYIYIYSSVDGHCGRFQALATVTNATMSTGAQLCFWDNDFVSFGHIPRSGIDRPCSSML